MSGNSRKKSAAEEAVEQNFTYEKSERYSLGLKASKSRGES